MKYLKDRDEVQAWFRSYPDKKRGLGYILLNPTTTAFPELD